jgi:hypothetical protein
VEDLRILKIICILDRRSQGRYINSVVEGIIKFTDNNIDFAVFIRNLSDSVSTWMCLHAHVHIHKQGSVSDARILYTRSSFLLTSSCTLKASQ